MMSVKLCAELVEACALRQAQGTTFAGSGHNLEGIGVSSGRFAVRPQRSRLMAHQVPRAPKPTQ